MSVDRRLVVEHYEDGPSSNSCHKWRAYLSIIDEDTGFKQRVPVADFGREYERVAKEFAEWFNRKLSEPESRP